ncbi:MAG: class E sortase [Actinomyces sp.]|nr:MAG: class E sortase [Actinomyces sp.]
MRAGPETPTEVPRLAVVLGGVGRFLITTGIVILLFVAYQLWGTNIQEARAQSDLRADLDAALAAVADLDDPLVAAPPTTSPPSTSPPSTSPPSTTADGGTGPSSIPEPTTTPAPTTVTAPGGIDPEILRLFFPDDGDAMARIEIPSLGVDKIVIRGVQVPDLRKGPGHYPTTALPGNRGNTAIAGHRTTYGAPFNRIDELRPGDEIVVTSVQGRFTYRVLDPTVAYANRLDDLEGIGDGHVIVDPGATWVLGDFGDDRLTLTACHPKYSARQRIIVAAELVGDPVDLPPAVAAAAADLDTGGTEAGDGPRDSGSDTPSEVAGTDQTGTDQTGTDGTDSGTGAALDDGAGSDPAGGSTAPDAVETTAADDLDQGLAGERDAIPAAVGWGLLAAALWIGGRLLGRRLAPRWDWTRRRGEIVGRLAVLVPVAVALWFCFEAADRALPAY